MSQLSEELHLLKQHVDNQFTRVELLIDRERERSQRLIAELKAELVELINEKFDSARRETDSKLGEFRRDMDRKFMWMIAGLVGVIAGQVALYFR